MIGIGAAVTRRPLPHHRAYGSVHGGSSRLRRRFFEQGWKAERGEVRVREPNRQGFRLREVPGAEFAGGGITRQPGAHPEFHQGCPATPWCFPLSPHSCPESQPDPAGKVDEHFRRFAEPEIAAPTRIYGISCAIVVFML